MNEYEKFKEKSKARYYEQVAKRNLFKEECKKAEELRLQLRIKRATDFLEGLDNDSQ